MKLTNLIVLALTGCADLPDPYTCDSSEPLCQKAERREEARFKREQEEAARKAMCPNGVLVVDRGMTQCVRRGGFSMNNVMGMPRW